VMVLLRAVGHVLDHVDAKGGPKMRAAIDSAWVALKERKPYSLIFWEFIDQERNNVLKEYAVGAGHNTTVYLNSSRPVEYEYLINVGPYKGRRQREVVLEAIEWWTRYLDAIDAAARAPQLPLASRSLACNRTHL